MASIAPASGIEPKGEKVHMKRIIHALHRQRKVLWLPLVSFAVVFATVFSILSYTPRQSAHANSPDWATFLGSNAHTDYNAAETAINPSNAPKLSVLWSMPSATKAIVTAQMIMANGMLYWGSWDGVMHASDPATGNQLWSTMLSTTPGGCSNKSKGVISSPVVATVPINGSPTSTLFIGAGAANLYALDALTGQILWQTNLQNNAAAFIYASPTYYNGSLYIGVASTGDCPLVIGEVVQVNASTGQVQNTFTLVPNGCIGSSVWGAITVDETTGMLYLGTGNADLNTCPQSIPYAQALVELNASNLSLVAYWQVPPSDLVGVDDDFGSAPTLFSATINGVPYSMVGIVNKDGDYYAFDRTNISAGPLWKVRVSVGGSAPAKNASIPSATYDGSYLYVAGSETTIGGQTCAGSLQQLDPATGNVLWADCLSASVLAPVFGVPGLLVIGSGAAMDVVNASNGQILYTYQDTGSNSGFWGAAMISGGVIYEGSKSGTLFAFTTSTISRLSSDPYTNIRNEHQTEVSPSSFSYGSTIVSAFQAGHGSKNGGSTNIGWATSTDGGSSWTNGFLPGTTKTVKGLYDRVENPSVAYDAAHGTWIITYNAFISSNSIAILASLSTNGGTSWSNPVTIDTSSTEDLDKSWGACDTTSTSPYYGHCYVEFHDERLSNLVELSTSIDGGQTWGAPLSTANSYAGFNGHPLVQPNGTVIVPVNSPVSTPHGNLKIMAFTSTDGGASWGSTVTVASTRSHTIGGSLRSLHIFSAGMDASGNVYLVWEDCRYESSCTANDLVMTTSADGVHWTAVTRIPIDAVGSGIDHFIPALAVDPTTSGSSAHLALVYYYLPVANCDTTTCQLDVGYVSSSDGGTTWSASTQLAGPMNVTWLTSTVWGYMTGDYITVSYSGGLAFPIFPVAFAPNGTTLNQAIYTATGGL